MAPLFQCTKLTSWNNLQPDYGKLKGNWVQSVGESYTSVPTLLIKYVYLLNSSLFPYLSDYYYTQLSSVYNSSLFREKYPLKAILALWLSSGIKKETSNREKSLLWKGNWNYETCKIWQYHRVNLSLWKAQCWNLFPGRFIFTIDISIWKIILSTKEGNHFRFKFTINF